MNSLRTTTQLCKELFLQYGQDCLFHTFERVSHGSIWFLSKPPSYSKLRVMNIEQVQTLVYLHRSDEIGVLV